MSHGQRTLYAFTCYSRTSTEEVTQGHAQLQRQFNLEFSELPVEIYMDTNPLTGQKGGNWLEGIVKALARSSFFFWWQHKEWFSKKVSRWELDCFRARIQDIERALGAQPGSLDFHLVEAIPLGEFDAETWSRYSVPADLVSYCESLDRQALFLAALRNDSAPPFEAKIYRGAVQQFDRQLQNILHTYGGLKALRAVTPSDDAFVKLWVEEAYRRGLVNGEPPAETEDAWPEARRYRHGRRVGRRLAHVERAGMGFLVTAEAERGGDLGPDPSSRDKDWLACWDAEGADEVEDDARASSMRLPTKEEADLLAKLLAGPAEAFARSGLVQKAQAFWYRDGFEDLPRSTNGADEAAIYLVVEEPG